MAHYKRGYAKTKTRGRKRHLHKWREGRNDFKRGGYAYDHFMSHWPKYWDVEMNTRPKRRKGRRLIVALYQGSDPDGLAWPLGNHKPHRYYW